MVYAIVPLLTPGLALARLAFETESYSRMRAIKHAHHEESLYSTIEDVQYCLEIPSVGLEGCHTTLKRILSTVEDIQCCGGDKESVIEDWQLFG